MSNRVEELESKVAELQAAVNGLTEELVETKERVRLLEEAVEVDLTTGSRPVGHGADEAAASAPDAERDAAPDDAADDPHHEPAAQAESRRETSAQPADDADFIDAEADDQIPSEAQSQGDEDKGEERESDDEAATEDDDIIVA
ncbi:DUF7518 family protein [Halobellus sp. GM3]|uniref:DUF7518 family protein n=1 Tax=Halobellus sp. GM3 TaxID=3458410 RepID=UPI00403DD22A